MELFEKIESFNKPIIKESKYKSSNHRIFEKYSSSIYQKYSFELLETLCKKSNFENKSLILHKSIYFLLKFIYKSKNNVLITNYDIIILVSFYLGIKIVENQKKIPNLTQLKNIYEEKYGRYQNEDIKNAEIIYIKLLEYKINFMTAYDYLYYIFKDNKEFMDLPKNNLENLIKDKSYYFCTRKPISIIEECIKDAENNKSLKFPTIIKRKIVQHSKIFRLDRVHHKDESLSTSISSGYFNYNNKNNDINNERNSPLKNILSKYIDNSAERLTEGNIINNYQYVLTSNNKCQNNNNRYKNNITLNNSHFDGNYNFTYSKKNINNNKYIKNYTKKKDKKNIQRLIYRTSIKEKLLQRNSNPLDKLSLNLNFNYFSNDYNSNNSQKKLFYKPYYKKQESKGCFTSNKKKENNVNFKVYKKRNTNNNNNNNNNKDDEFRCTLKKKMLFDDDGEFDFSVE